MLALACGVVYMSVVRSLKPRWHSRDREDTVALFGILALVGGAVAVRVWLMVGYAPAFTGYPDSGEYVWAASDNIFRDAQRPAGYPFFLRLIHHFSDSLSFVVAVQHLAGVVAGVLLYKAVRRTGAPRWLGWLPAGIVFFGGTGLILEHSLLADSLLAFLQVVGLYLTIRALYSRRLRWSLLAGTAIGISFWVKTAGISTAVVAVAVLLLAAPGGKRDRVRSALAVAAAVVAMVAVYVGAQYYFTGFLGYERQSAWNLYGRVATFVNCSSFTPPPGTRFLCPSEPVGHRQPQAYYMFGSGAPAVERFGPPWVAPPSANASLKAFSVAAIEHEPIAYAGAIMAGLGRYVFPRDGEGETPPQLRTQVMSEATTVELEPNYGALYPGDIGYIGSAAEEQPLAVYESYTRVQGPLLIILLMAAIGGLLCVPRNVRGAAAVFTLTALVGITFAVATDSYGARFAYPTFGPLAAGAALGAWGIGSVLARKIRLRGRLRGTPEANLEPLGEPGSTGS
jgi:hypothetical protein